jgi:hypothetical protein
VRNATLHATLESFTADAASRLAAEADGGAEIPFELVDAGVHARGSAPLYCYRPLTGSFIENRHALLRALPSHAPAVRALADLDGVEGYLRRRGESRVPDGARECAEEALRAFLAAVFAERSRFGFEAARFEAAYAELEHALYEGREVTTVIAPLLGLALDHRTTELAIGEGLSLVRGDSLPGAPAEAVWADADQPSVLAALTVPQEPAGRSVVSLARQRFRRTLTALRLFERGGYALGPMAWARVDAGAWRPVALGSSGRPRSLTFVSAEQEDELRAFCNLIARRAPVSPSGDGSGELAWALARFEMGCERLAPFEALTDYLLALRALLEPEGPSSGRLAQRLAVICASPEERAALAERTAHAISLERAMIAGLAPAAPGVDALVDELAEHLRAILRDVLCGHLDRDLRGMADRLLAEAAATPV